MVTMKSFLFNPTKTLLPYAVYLLLSTIIASQAVGVGGQSLEVSDDSWVRSSRPDDNYGGTYGLQVKDKSTDTRTTLIRFTVPSSLTTVSRATLTLHFRDKKGDTGTIFAKTIVGQPWNESRQRTHVRATSCRTCRRLSIQMLRQR